MAIIQPAPAAPPRASASNRIATGRIASPRRIIIHGDPKIGKSSLAALAPRPLFLDCERGSAALDVARLSVYDCLAVAIAGAGEPVSVAVRELVSGEGGTAQASAIGLPARIPARAAAMLNGTAAHALDYDDTHFDFVGHPTVAVLPAALAVAEQQQASGKDLLEAFLTGVEVTCRVGGWLGRPHYNAGFHQTATSGAFGAAAAASPLRELHAERAAHALGLAATRASGLIGLPLSSPVVPSFSCDGPPQNSAPANPDL